MNEKGNERLSALVDEELSEFEVHHVLKALGKSDTLKGEWQAYHLIGDALRQQLAPRIDLGFAERVAERIAAEPVHGQEPGTRPESDGRRVRSRSNSTVGFALAASVSAMAVFGVLEMNLQVATGVDGAPLNLAAVAQSSLPVSPISQGPVDLAGELVAYPVNFQQDVSNGGEGDTAADLYDYLVNYQHYSQEHKEAMSYISLASYTSL